ncbi:MAG: hypothetical protein FJY95_21050 [Candidatus Handelsmanbacteria bacterium]|nr:hypothetical protein [Candidatus Handelsmanbacteria bacterium]
MLGKLIRTRMVLRLELQTVPVDWGLVFLAWLRRPAIEITLQAQEEEGQRARLRRRLDEVYPF